MVQHTRGVGPGWVELQLPACGPRDGVTLCDLDHPAGVHIPAACAVDHVQDLWPEQGWVAWQFR